MSIQTFFEKFKLWCIAAVGAIISFLLVLVGIKDKKISKEKKKVESLESEIATKESEQEVKDTLTDIKVQSIQKTAEIKIAAETDKQEALHADTTADKISYYNSLVQKENKK